jgi:plastocyanin
MEKTTRRNILKAVAAGGAAAGFGMVLKSRTSESAFAQGKSDEAHGKHGPNVDGPLANATVSFGQWRTDLTPSLDRRTNAPPAPTANQHLLIPYEPTIRAGGAVNFIISGLHNVVIYDHGTKPTDIDTSLTIPMLGPPNLPLINDPDKRIYRGPDPSILTTLDRVEVVTLGEPGIYLVICGFLFHFQDNMFGYIKVVP